MAIAEKDAHRAPVPRPVSGKHARAWADSATVKKPDDRGRSQARDRGLTPPGVSTSKMGFYAILAYRGIGAGLASFEDGTHPHQLLRCHVNDADSRCWNAVPSAIADNWPWPVPSVEQAAHAGGAERPATAEVMEHFCGFIDRVEGDVAYVALDNDRGERLAGPYPFAELASAGVEEGGRFSLSTIEDGAGTVRFEIRPLPAVPLSDEEQRAILRDIRQRLGNTLLDDN